MKRKESSRTSAGEGSSSKTSESVVPRHKNLRLTLQEIRQANEEAKASNTTAQILLPGSYGGIDVDPESNEKTYRLKQTEIVNQSMVDLNTAKNFFDFQLRFGPYRVDYSRNGRYLLLGGSKGHVAIMDCLQTEVKTEIQLQQEIHDVHYLHNESMFAVAQKKYVYIYDYKGIEIHCMKKHTETHRIDFLPYHYLLVTGGSNGWIRWHDVSIGEYVNGIAGSHGPIRGKVLECRLDFSNNSVVSFEA